MRDVKPAPRPPPTPDHRRFIERVLAHARTARAALDRGRVMVADDELAALIAECNRVLGARP